MNTNDTKYIFPGLHSCLTSQNPEGRPHAFAYVLDVNTTEIAGSVQHPSKMSAAEALSLYLSQSAVAAVVPQPAVARRPAVVRRTCVCCAAIFKVSLDASSASSAYNDGSDGDDNGAYDAADMLKPRSSALICTTCTAKPCTAKPSESQDQNCFVCSECTRMTLDALVEAKKCVGGAFGVSKSVHIKDMIAFHLFLQRIDASIARSFLVFPAQVAFNTTIYQGTAASVDYVEALSIVNRARHPATAHTVKPSTSTPAAIIYTAFHCFFTTQKCLNIQIAARSSVDSVIIAAKNAKSAARIPAAPPGGPQSGGLQDRKRKHDDSVCTSRRCDNEIRFAEAHRLNMTLSIERIRSVLKTRD